MKKRTKYYIKCSIGLLIVPLLVAVIILTDYLVIALYDGRNYSKLVKQVTIGAPWDATYKKLKNINYLILPLDKWGGYYDKNILEELTKKQEHIYVCFWETWYSIFHDLTFIEHNEHLYVFVLVSSDGRIINYAPEISDLLGKKLPLSDAGQFDQVL